MRAICYRNLYRVSLVMVLVMTMLAGCAALPGNPFAQETPTPIPVDANAPVLGGSQAAFTRKFGQPLPLKYIYRYTASNGEFVVLTLGLIHVLATGRIRVSKVILEPEGASKWDEMTAYTMYEPFFPPDAMPAGDIASNDGTHHLYTSALLANTFPAEAFVDGHGKKYPPGTFDVICNSKIFGDIPDSFSCGLMVGVWTFA